MSEPTELILLLCSDPVLTSVLTEILRRPGYVVLAEAGLGGAVDRISEVTPDLLIIRPHIGNMSGHDAAVYLRKKVPGLPVLIVYGLPDDDRLINREELQGFGIFPAPFDPAGLLDNVARILAAHSHRVKHS